MLFIGLEKDIELFRKKLQQQQFQDLIGEDDEEEDKQQSVEKPLTKKKLEKLNSQKAQQIRPPIEMSDIAMNEEYFDDIISLKSEESIIEVCKKKPRKEHITPQSIDDDDFDDLAFSQENSANKNNNSQAKRKRRPRNNQNNKPQRVFMSTKLNQEIFEKFQKFTISIDQVPDLANDGSQAMVLRCFKHHQYFQDKSALSKNDDEEFFDILKSIDKNQNLCPLTILIRTNIQGYWQIEKEITNLYLHEPLMHQMQQSTILKKRSMKEVNNLKFDEIVNRSKNNNNIGNMNNQNDFESEFQMDETNLNVNFKLKKNTNKYEFDPEVSTKPTMSPQTEQQISEDYPQPENNISLLSDKFFNSPTKNEPLSQNKKRQEIPYQVLNRGTVQEAQNVLVNVLDSTQFLNKVVNDVQLMQPPNNLNLKLNNKKNIFKKQNQLINQNSTNKLMKNEISPLIKTITKNEQEMGNDYSTKEEDTHKMIRYFKQYLSKGDFFRYETDQKNENQVKTMIISSESMKEKYLVYRDVVALAPCFQSQSNNRFNLFGIAIYVTQNDQASLEFALKNFLFYVGQLPKILIIERNSFAFEYYQNIINKFDFLKKDENELYKLIFSLPIIEDKEELDIKLKDLQKINFNQLDNLKDFLRKLQVDKQLWSLAYRDVQNQRIFTEELECSYSNEPKVVGANINQKLEQNFIFREFAQPYFTLYSLQRFKLQMQKANNYQLIETNIQMTDSIDENQGMARQWRVGNIEKKQLVFTVNLVPSGQFDEFDEEIDYLQCQCTFSQISGIPCSHEFWIQNCFYESTFQR
ncbi:UNKNOWN [Stylonychia lemnae]|uniref:SWIM-type domain-containing protein n=1 Tax=Stylonychia lemnae TaxID=5949 RepID=A0A078ABC5_STYLE|nr:UNKNOWN [Stylonychia lemnae]|eukprot:CDW78093.1 UNKNOWN [Stylonychia lemnae]